MTPWIAVAPLSISVQQLEMRRLFPWGTIRANESQIVWSGEIAPDEYSRSYTLEMRYKLKCSPKVYVRDPDLRELAGNRRLPHMYDQAKQQLCLFLPNVGLWSPDRLIGNTVMLWAIMWLRYFEIWLITDVWHGGGEHPPS